ncbi:hypothetical protein D3C87_1640080 [compost metagenome]
MPDQAIGEWLQVYGHLLQLGHAASRMLDQHMPGRGKAHPPGLAQQQGGPKAGFKPFYAQTDGGGGQVTTLRTARQIAFLRNGQEDLQVSQVVQHCVSLRQNHEDFV